MFRSELDSFICKFLQLREAGMIAHLDVDTHAGQAWVGLRVMLGSVQNQQQSQQRSSSRNRSPSYFRRQERRRAEKQASEIVAEEAKSSEKKVEAGEASTSEGNADKAYDCELCDFQSNRENGLKIHMSKKHAKIEQLGWKY